MMRGLRVVGVALGLSCLSVGVVVAAAAKRPNPPQQLCIGSKCVNTPTGGAKVKWNPGHYGASGGLFLPGNTLSKFSPEMDDMLKDSWIQGYRLFVTWAALDAGPISFTASVGGGTKGTLRSPVDAGTYWASFGNGEYRQITLSTTTTATWSDALSTGSVTTAHLYRTELLDQILERLKTRYGTPKQLVLAIVSMSFTGGSRRSNDFSRIPQYITTNVSKYGASPDGSSSGWWGPPPGATQGAYSAALYRQGVAAEYAALGAALGAKYDSDPNFEGIMDQENSAVTGPAQNFPPADPSYSDEAYIATQKMFLTAWVAAMPHTNVVSENTFMRNSVPTQEFAVWLMNNRIAPGTADVSPQSYYDGQAGRVLSNWGLAAYAGQEVGSISNLTDMRGTARAMVDVEGPDIGSSVGTKLGGAPLDIVMALNKTYKASHAFWCHIPAGKGPAPAPKWPEVTAVLKANPLTNTGYPGNYP